MADATSFRMAYAGATPGRLLADRAFSRMAGARLVGGNQIRLLRDAAENYPAWMEAIRRARKQVHFETYALLTDRVGEEFAELFANKAREGVKVRLIHDWLGTPGIRSFFFWRRLRSAGVEVRSFNPPRLDDPIEWLRRDHRKIITVDGRIGFVSGLCVGQCWVGDPVRDSLPWRDTGVRIEGPAVLELDRAFARVWNSRPGPSQIQPEEDCDSLWARPRGTVALRIVAGEPSYGGLYRLDLLIAALARKSIWLTDAYFLATPSYVQSLRAAALDGVDVRLLVPRTTDIPVVRALSRVGYRTLLEAGVRIFEWNGSMLHAKTAVADGLWSRVGSTNLNIASWMGNYELDVVVEDEGFSHAMREMYLDDLEHATEIVLREGARVRPREPRKGRFPVGSARGSAGRAATGVVAMGSTVGAAIARPRLLGRAEAPLMVTMALLLLGLATLTGFFPRTVGILLAISCGWFGLALLLKAFRLYRLARRESAENEEKAKRVE